MAQGDFLEPLAAALGRALGRGCAQEEDACLPEEWSLALGLLFFGGIAVDGLWRRYRKWDGTGPREGVPWVSIIFAVLAIWLLAQKLLGSEGA